MTDCSYPLIDATWLTHHLGDDDLVILCASMGNPEKSMAKGIPGALLADIDGDFSDLSAGLPHTAPADLAGLFAAYGISDTTRVVIYDRLGNIVAPRVWWLALAAGLRDVAVVDGGLPAWERAGGPLARVQRATDLDIQPGVITTQPRELFVPFDALGVVVDARSAGRFAGSEPEPRPGLNGGHIPGSHNLPYPELFDSEGCFLKPEQLREKFAGFGQDGMVFSCGSGVTACIDALAATLAGFQDIKVYDGSWTQWGDPALGLPYEMGAGSA
ncbi:sulfurtransferase [Staphylococcus chromogenes]|nr:sulfurtransferase [Staphylococcus chromogenes]